MRVITYVKHLPDLKYQVMGGGEGERDFSEQDAKNNGKAENSIV